MIAEAAGARITRADGSAYGPIEEASRNELIGSDGSVHETPLAYLESEQALQVSETGTAD